MRLKVMTLAVIAVALYLLAEIGSAFIFPESHAQTKITTTFHVEPSK